MAGVQGYETAGGIKGCFGGHRAELAAKILSQTAAKSAKVDPALGPKKAPRYLNASQF